MNYKQQKDQDTVKVMTPQKENNDENIFPFIPQRANTLL